jgi:hypothetical protein
MLFSSLGFTFGFLPVVLATFQGLITRGLFDAAKLWLIAAHPRRFLISLLAVYAVLLLAIGVNYAVLWRAGELEIA